MSGLSEKTMEHLLLYALGADDPHETPAAGMLHELEAEARTWAGVFFERSEAEGTPGESRHFNAADIAGIFASFERRIEVITELLTRERDERRPAAPAAPPAG